jgi:hypothetical protein
MIVINQSGVRRDDGAALDRPGKSWVKPNLGLVDYNSSKANNLVAFTVRSPPGVFKRP